jgi:hypothetical protein
VTTSSGTAEDSIDLSWGCDGEEAGEEEVAEEGNNCPVISDFMLSGFDMETYPCNQYNTYICDASDPDGDELTYNWDLSAGTIEEIENNAVIEGAERGSAMSFYTPDTPGIITITVVVSDGVCEVTEDATMEVVCE